MRGRPALRVCLTPSTTGNCLASAGSLASGGDFSDDVGRHRPAAKAGGGNAGDHQEEGIERAATEAEDEGGHPGAMSAGMVDPEEKEHAKGDEDEELLRGLAASKKRGR